MIKNVTVSGITEINFNTDGKSPYFYASEKYCWIKNRSDAVMYVSLDENCTAGADGTALISAGESRRIIISPENKIYISGMGDAEIDTGDNPECPFNSVSKGGGSSSVKELIKFGNAGTILNLKNINALNHNAEIPVISTTSELNFQNVIAVGTANNVVSTLPDAQIIKLLNASTNDAIFGSGFDSIIIGYDFGEPVVLNYFLLRAYSSETENATSSYKIQYSNDGIAWTDLSELSVWSQGFRNAVETSNKDDLLISAGNTANIQADMWRIKFNISDNTISYRLYDIQFYGDK